MRAPLQSNCWRVVRQLVTEGVVLALIGGAIGLGIGAAGVRALLQMAPPDLPRLDVIPIDARVVLFSIAVTILTGILVGLGSRRNRQSSFRANSGYTAAAASSSAPR